MGWVDEVNELFNKFCSVIDDTGIKNTRGFSLNVYKRALPENFAKENCPAVAIIKDNVSGRKIETDQYELEKPLILRIVMGVEDWSQVSLDAADTITDDLINKIIVALDANPTLDNLAKGIELESVDFDGSRKKGIWFSEPTLTFDIEGIALM